MDAATRQGRRAVASRGRRRESGGTGSLPAFVGPVPASDGGGDSARMPRSALIRAGRCRQVAGPVAIGPVDDAVAAARIADEAEARIAAAHARGVEEGRAMAQAAAREEIEVAVQLFDSAVRGLAAERRRLAGEAGLAVRELAVAIAAHVMHHEVEQGTPVAIALATEAVSRLEAAGALTLRVHPLDAPALRGQTAALAARAGGSPIDVVACDSVERGGCVVEGTGMQAHAELLDGLAVVAEELGVTLAAGRTVGRRGETHDAAGEMHDAAGETRSDESGRDDDGGAAIRAAA